MESGGDAHEGESCINCRFLYTTMHKSLEAGRVKTDAYIDNQMILDVSFCAKCYQEAIGANDSAPTEQLQSLRSPLSPIVYRKRVFRVMAVSWAILKSKTSGPKYLRGAAFI